ncbi:hypothetical protein [Mesorhizobium sp. M7A.F.Ca.US.010.02.1.1]|uniref:hypothetical protein n=1 Tax=Mesorhizobium sp. M7A.F.Ca.US.010.02.1.1 TaxID=2496743 RepID=UPI00267B7F9B
MAIKVGDEVAVMATVLKRVTEDRVSVSIPGYNFPHSVTLAKGQPMELSGDVTQIDGDKATVSFGQWSPWIWTRCTWCKATSRRSEGI